MPPITPNQKKNHHSAGVYAHMKNPMLTNTPPVTDTQNGPFLSWRRPARTKESANTNTAMLKIQNEISARFHPNSFSSGATNTLKPYRAPRARFMASPPTTRHQRLM